MYKRQGVDLALIVAEPTLSGIHDMERVMDLAVHFGVLAKVFINKCDINWDNTRTIEEICQKRGIEVIGHLPFSEEVVRSLVAGVPVVKFSQGEIAEEITTLWRKIEAIFGAVSYTHLPGKVLVFPHLCHGCGGCSLLCPQGAITEVGREIGTMEIGRSGDIESVSYTHLDVYKRQL